jgi:5,5'-dehydrodivanillate O-demethylase
VQPFEETVHRGFKDKIQLANYSAEELGGLIFAYIGPKPAPLVPRWDLLVEEGCWREVGTTITACNWMQTVENILDPVHVEWLHGVFRNYAAERTGKLEMQRKRIRHRKVAFDVARYGIIKRRYFRDGKVEEHPLLFPTVLRQANRTQIRVPIDDTHTYIVYVHFVPDSAAPRPANGEVPVEYRKPFKNPVGARHPFTKFRFDDVDAQDFMAWETQGPILDRTRERLAGSDRGVVMYREMLAREIKKVQQGVDPMNVFRDPNHPIIDTQIDKSLEVGKAGSVRYHVPPKG